jgi:hypothetical protein
MNIEKKYGVMIATPCYGGQLTEAYLHGILQTTVKAQNKGIRIHLNTMGNESLITRARNTLVTQFLDFDLKDPDRFTHLFFIDSDIGFSGENVIRLVESDYDIACGIYPRKSIDWNSVPKFIKETGEENIEAKALGYNLNFAHPTNIKVKNGFTEVLDAATGFMCIKKEVFYKMKEAYSNLKYTSDQIINNERFSSNNCYAFFDCIIDEKSNRYLSEDYAFCRLWQKLGGKIFADVISPLTHYGTYPFRGNVWTKFSIEGDKENANDIQQSKD